MSSEVFRGVRFMAGGLAVALAVLGLSVLAVDQLMTRVADGVDGSTVSLAMIEPEHRVLADEWNDRISSDNYWRANRNSGSNAWSNANNNKRAKPSQLQGPPQQPAWFVQPPSSFWPGEETRSQPSKSPRTVSGYRTVCVRQCDGFFFPISFGASEGSLSRDQATCTNTCPGARLYHYKSASEDPDDMVDNSGQPYSKMKNASLFRTQYVENCKCKPHPWEREATDKHRIFALEDQRRKGNRAVVAELDELKSKNLETRYNRRRPADRRRGQKDDAVNVPAAEALVVAQNAAPRSDANRGQGGDRGSDRIAFHQSTPSAQGVVTGSIAAAASAATVQSVTDAQTQSGTKAGTRAGGTPITPVARTSADAGATIELSIVGGQEMPAPPPIDAVQGPVEREVATPVPTATKSRQGRGASRERSGSNSTSRPPNMMRLGAVARQSEPRAAAFQQRRTSEWARNVFNP